MKKIILRLLVGVLVVSSAALVGLYLLYYPRHYTAREFNQLAEIAYAAENLRLAGIRGVAKRDYLPDAIWNLEPDEVRVYPSGVLIRLRGFFSYESGLYVPSATVAAKINARSLPVYEYLNEGVYSYKVEG